MACSWVGNPNAKSNRSLRSMRIVHDDPAVAQEQAAAAEAGAETTASPLQPRKRSSVVMSNSEGFRPLRKRRSTGSVPKSGLQMTRIDTQAGPRLESDQTLTEQPAVGLSSSESMFTSLQPHVSSASILERYGLELFPTQLFVPSSSTLPMPMPSTSTLPTSMQSMHALPALAPMPTQGLVSEPLPGLDQFADDLLNFTSAQAQIPGAPFPGPGHLATHTTDWLSLGSRRLQQPASWPISPTIGPADSAMPSEEPFPPGTLSAKEWAEAMKVMESVEPQDTPIMQDLQTATKIPLASLAPVIALYTRSLFVSLPVVDQYIQGNAATVLLKGAIEPPMYSLLCAIAAVTTQVMRTDAQSGEDMGIYKRPEVYAGECLRELNMQEQTKMPDKLAMSTCCLLSLYFWHIDDIQKAWQFLNDGISLIQIHGLDRSSYYEGLDNMQAAESRNLYWTMAMMERRQATRMLQKVRLRTDVGIPRMRDPKHALASFCTNIGLMCAVYSARRGDTIQIHDIGVWAQQTIDTINDAQKFCKHFKTVSQLSTLIASYWTHLHVWLILKSFDLQKMAKVREAMSQDVPLLLMQDIVLNICRHKPVVLEPLGIDPFRDCIDIAEALCGSMARLNEEAWMKKMSLLEHFALWLDQSLAVRPSTAVSTFLKKLASARTLYYDRRSTRPSLS